MPLDPDTQYFAMGDGNAGAQPADNSRILGIDPSLDLQGAAAQSAPAAGQGLMALMNLIANLTGKKGAAKDAAAPVTVDPSALPAGGVQGALANAAGPAQGGALGALAGMTGPPPVAAPVPAAPVPASMPVPAPPAAAPGADPSASPLAALGAMTGGAGQAIGDQPQPPQMPQMPQHNNTIAKIIGAISALSGGPGGRIVSTALANQKAGDTDKYNQQVQAYQQQQHDQQQTTENQGGFIENLAKVDPATQEQIVRNMSPAAMTTNGYTPAQLQNQFFDKDGKFLPVGAADKPDNPAATARAQASARNTLYRLTPEGQQSYHDSFKGSPDDWVEQTGLPYDGFTPSATAKDETAAGSLAEKINNDAVTGGAKMSDAQNANYKTLTSLTPAMQKATYQSYASDPQSFQAKYGVPYAGFVPGSTEANAVALQGVNNRETDAQRTDATHISLDKLNIAARAAIDHENNQVTMRGQDLRNQLGNKQINARVQMFNQRYGAGSGGAAEKQYQGLLKTDMEIQKRMTALSAPQKDAFGDPGLSLRDVGRIDADGNAVPNPVPTAAYKEYMQLQEYDQQLQQQMKGMTAPALSQVSAMLGGQPQGAGSLPPAPVTVSGNQPNSNTHLPPGPRVAAPYAPPLPGFPAYNTHNAAPPSSGLITLRRMAGQPAPPPVHLSPAYMTAQHLTPAQIHTMTTAQLLQRLATRYSGKR